MLCIYIPPGLPIQALHDFHQHVIKIFDYLLTDSPNANLYVCGDLNQYDFSFLNQCFDLCNIVNFPTFGNHTLDKFFCGEDVSQNFNAFSAPPLGSVVHLHKIVFVSKNFHYASDVGLLHKVFDLRRSNVEKFQTIVANTDWTRISSFL